MSAETRFEWDPAKAVSNKAKHGVSFEIATEVWLDPLRVERQDRWEAGEERWQTIGTVGGETLVLVAHTVKSEEGFEQGGRGWQTRINAILRREMSKKAEG